MSDVSRLRLCIWYATTQSINTCVADKYLSENKDSQNSFNCIFIVQTIEDSNKNCLFWYANYIKQLDVSQSFDTIEITSQFVGKKTYICTILKRNSLFSCASKQKPFSTPKACGTFNVSKDQFLNRRSVYFHPCMYPHTHTHPTLHIENQRSPAPYILRTNVRKIKFSRFATWLPVSTSVRFNSNTIR